MKKILLLIIIGTLLQACDQISQQTPVIKSNQPVDETEYLNRIEKLKDDAQMAQNPFIKDSIINSFNKYAIDSIHQVKNWIMVVDGIEESYLLGPKVYVLTLTANNEKFEDVFPEKSKLKSVTKLLSSIRHLIPGDSVIVCGHPEYRNAKNEIDYTGVTEITFESLTFDITYIKKK